MRRSARSCSAHCSIGIYVDVAYLCVVMLLGSFVHVVCVLGAMGLDKHSFARASAPL